MSEDIAEMEYQSLKCSRPYRLIVVRKNISVQKSCFRSSGVVRLKVVSSIVCRSARRCSRTGPICSVFLGDRRIVQH